MMRKSCLQTNLNDFSTIFEIDLVNEGINDRQMTSVLYQRDVKRQLTGSEASIGMCNMYLYIFILCDDGQNCRRIGQQKCTCDSLSSQYL